MLAAHLEAADVTAPKIFKGRRPADRRKYRPVFVLNPASGTLKIPVHLRLKVENALSRAAHRFQFGLYRSLFSLYLRKFALDARCAGICGLGYSGRSLFDFLVH